MSKTHTQVPSNQSGILSFLRPTPPATPPIVSLGFPEIIRRSIEPRRAVWRTRLLSSTPLTAQAAPAERILKILTDISEPTSALHKQLSKYMREQKELAGGGVWTRYYESYDTLAAFSDSYRKLLQFADEAFPKNDSTILDIGAATLNFSLYLVLKAPDRRMVAIDSLRTGMVLGRRKMELGAGKERMTRHRAFATSILDPNLPTKNVDGAIIFNLLGRITERPAVLDRLHQMIRKGGTLVAFEFTDRAHSEERMRKYLLDMAVSSAAQHSPMNEFDLALVSSVHIETFTGPFYTGPSLLPQRDWEGLARNAGFEVVESKSFCGGLVRGFQLRKP